MELDAADRAFRDELRAWLAANLPPGWRERPFSRQPFANEAERVRFLRDWQRKLHAGGWAGIAWPPEYGGRGATIRQQQLYDDAMAAQRAPELIGANALNMLGPTLIHWGTEAQRRRFLPKILSAEELWCQGYSEPDAGSDLASLQTRAVRDGDDYLVSGAKIWTSYAHYADWMFCLVRSDPDAPKHRGISYLLIDMRSPGISLRPLRQITGGQEFNAVFFDQVRVPRANLVGEENRGWQVAMATLAFERGNLGNVLQLEALLAALLEIARAWPSGQPALTDPRWRDRLAQAAIEVRLWQRLAERNRAAQLRGEVPRVDASLGKLFGTELAQRLAALGLELLGPYGQLLLGSAHALADGFWPYEWLWDRALTIAGGSSEIQRNILAERGLGLPRG